MRKLILFSVVLLALAGCVTIYRDTSLLHIGMTDDEVVELFGPPPKVNRTVSRSGVHEQWIYHNISYRIIYTAESTVYLYFDDGRLVSWQD